ncbi:hypothetical protein [Streptomyces sp. NPDC093984]|uniref:MmyB family transcriptional regulator n=1 Tax=Streptomyces sp. NPDC093984 TaxID=3366052 RepID=UPI0037F20FD7
MTGLPRQLVSPRDITPARSVTAEACAVSLLLQPNPAYIFGGNYDVLSHNQAAHELFPKLITEADRPANFVRWVFLEPVARDVLVDERSETAATPATGSDRLCVHRFSPDRTAGADAGRLCRQQRTARRERSRDRRMKEEVSAVRGSRYDGGGPAATRRATAENKGPTHRG